MNHKSLAAVAVGAVLGVTAMAAQAASVATMSVTAGTFEMPGVTSGPQALTILNGGNIIGGYIGSGGGALPASTPDNTAIANFIFFGNPVNVLTAAENLGDTNNPAGTIAGGPTPNGSVDGSSLSMDMSSWFANWNDNDFNQGNAMASGSVSGDCTVGCSYNLSWDSLIVGGPFNGFTGVWNIEGMLTVEAAAPVPVPAAAWLFASGLLGLVGVARKKKAA